MGWHQQVNKLDTCGIILNLRISMIMLDTNLMIYENMLESVGAHDEWRRCILNRVVLVWAKFVITMNSVLYQSLILTIIKQIIH